MRIIFLLLPASCSVAEHGEVLVHTCPTCNAAYQGFDTCAFFDVDQEYVVTNMLVDAKNYQGFGNPIKQNGYMHHKFCFNESHAVFGSANPTKTGLGKNDNIVVLFESKQLAKNFATEYKYLQTRNKGSHMKSWTFNDRPIKHLFCPRDNCESAVLNELKEAKSSIVFLAFSFTSDQISETLQEKHRNGVHVTGVVESWGANQRGGEFSKLTQVGIPVFRAQTDGLMHHKAFIIDNKTVIFGSYNPTKNANTRNAETIVITEEPQIVTALRSEFERIIAISSRHAS